MSFGQAAEHARHLLRKGPFELLRRGLPKTRSGEFLFSWILFLYVHRRLPGPYGGGFNDSFFRLKTSREMEDPLRVLVTDKELAKLYTTAKLGEGYAVPTLACLRSAAEVRSFAFPPRCVIKPTHLSGQVILRTAGEGLDLERVSGWFGRNFYEALRERNYRTLRPKVIVEPLVFDTTELLDYKVFCVEGRPRLIFVDVDRWRGHCRAIYDTDWRKLPFAVTHPPARAVPEPANLKEMLEVAAALSAPFSLVRIDLYSDGRKIQVGELTNVSAAAHERFMPPEAEEAASAILFG